ncbi:hypothetical protein [Mitsuaria sp. GD03876]|uniref:hypothetical protein n=1 Tax=Mitsuaria sp. GD03876 TaxID=2975399 RepID=UPI0024472571|nr:hypothetical protein [Mitsuaria sp. GD03876]MDH0868267.1 hypothetical protein [Mitsuaria sp. GD03876]
MMCFPLLFGRLVGPADAAELAPATRLSSAAIEWLSALDRPGHWCDGPQRQALMTAVATALPRVRAFPPELRVHASDRCAEPPPGRIDLQPGPALVVVHAEDARGRHAHAASIRCERHGVPKPAPMFLEPGDGFFQAVAWAVATHAGRPHLGEPALDKLAADWRHGVSRVLAADPALCERLVEAVPLRNLSGRAAPSLYESLCAHLDWVILDELSAPLPPASRQQGRQQGV